MTIAQIAESLNFSDQFVFSKFSRNIPVKIQVPTDGPFDMMEVFS
jgi:hypothetical protein